MLVIKILEKRGEEAKPGFHPLSYCQGRTPRLHLRINELRVHLYSQTQITGSCFFKIYLFILMSLLLLKHWGIKGQETEAAQ